MTNLEREAQNNEFKLLSALMTDPTGGLVDLVSPIISERDFCHTKNGVCYWGILQVIADGGTLNPVSLYSEVKGYNKVGEDYIHSLISDGTGQGALVEAYAENIRNGALVRGLSTLSNEIKAKVDDGDNPTEINKFIQEKSDEIADISGGVVKRETSLGYWFGRVIESMTDDRMRKSRFSTGFSSLDRFLDGGLEFGNLDVIAGRTGMGKTSFGLNILGNVAMSGIPSMMVSIEMTGDMIMRKLISSRCKIREGDLMSNNLTDEQWENLRKLYTEEFKDKVVHIDDRSYSLLEVETSIRHMVR